MGIYGFRNAGPYQGTIGSSFRSKVDVGAQKSANTSGSSKTRFLESPMSSASSLECRVLIFRWFLYLQGASGVSQIRPYFGPILL